MIDLIIIGGGGHAKSCIDVIESEGKYNIVGIIDVKSKIGETVLGYPIIGSDDDIKTLITKYKSYFIALGQIKTSAIRKKIFNNIKDFDINFPTIISPKAYVSKHSNVGIGNIVMHNVIINSSVKIGDFNIFNSNSVIEHDCNIEDFNHISVSSTVCGTVNIGSNSFIGAGATINNNIILGNNIVIGSSSLVNKNILEKGIYIGNPIRKYK